MASRWVLLLIAQALAAASVVISNVEPRLTTDGEILPAHDGGVYEYDSQWYFYGMSYGLCKENPTNGCTNHTTGACGFTLNHDVLVYSSPDLSQTSFSYEGSALPKDRPEAIYYRPKVIHNAKTQKYVLWINWRTCLSCSLHYLTAVADAPGGPFTLAVKDVPIRFKDGGDFTVFVDEDGAGYLLYQSRASGHVASVERLSDDYTTSLGAVASSGLFGPKGIEAPAMFMRKGMYYILVGKNCCFCKAGSGVIVLTATSPMGPWTERGQVGRYSNGTSVSGAQQNFVIPVTGSNGKVTFVWTGDRWQSASDRLKDHDLQTWLPLEWDDEGGHGEDHSKTSTYRFIHSSNGTLGLFYENNATRSKHHVPSCDMCQQDLCKLRTPVPPEYLDSLKDGPNFTCDMLSSVPMIKHMVWRDSFELDVALPEVV